MLFSSTIFLSIFLPGLICVYFTIKKELQNYVLLLFSLVFYAWGEPRYLSIMIIVILINYLSAILISYTKNKRVILILSIFINLSILIYFKYFNFIIENINKLKLNPLPTLNIIMPIGISFFIFQAISYVFDVYKNEVPVQKNIYKLALYVSFFPQLIAGPIVKYHEVQKEIENRETNLENFYLGLFRFIIGLSKKVLIANTLGEVADKVFLTDILMIDYKITWIGAICYSLQLYFDFSGYSDMAIGLGRIFGFYFLENFNYPYISRSITEFWRRWHISLGTWFKEYLYIPLGGNRKSSRRTYLNLLLVFIAFLIILFMKEIIGFIRNNLIIKMDNDIDLFLNLDGHKKLLLLPNYYYNSRTIGDIITKDGKEKSETSKHYGRRYCFICSVFLLRKRSICWKNNR